MGYSSTLEVDMVLGQALTNARAENAEFGVQQNLLDVGHVRDTNRIPDDVVHLYISFADSQIDGILSQQYYTPLKKCVNGQWNLDADISEYNQTVEIADAYNLVPGDQIEVFNLTTGENETNIVNEITDQYSFSVLTNFTTNFEGSNIVVKRIQYPPIINQISARYAASFIYDKYFAAQNAPNVSDYGKEMRNVAMGQLNDILNGKVILRNQLRVGDRWGNPWASDAYSHQDRGYSTSERNMSKPSG